MSHKPRVPFWVLNSTPPPPRRLFGHLHLHAPWASQTQSTQPYAWYCDLSRWGRTGFSGPFLTLNPHCTEPPSPHGGCLLTPLPPRSLFCGPGYRLLLAGFSATPPPVSHSPLAQGLSQRLPHSCWQEECAEMMEERVTADNPFMDNKKCMSHFADHVGCYTHIRDSSYPRWISK